MREVNTSTSQIGDEEEEKGDEDEDEEDRVANHLEAHSEDEEESELLHETNQAAAFEHEDGMQDEEQ